MGQIDIKTNPVPVAVNEAHGWVIISHADLDGSSVLHLIIGRFGRLHTLAGNHYDSDDDEGDQENASSHSDACSSFLYFEHL